VTSAAPRTGSSSKQVTGTLATVLALRQRTHRAADQHLAPAVTAYTSTAPADLIRAAIDPAAPRNGRKAAAGLAIASTLYASGAADEWQQANSDNYHAAYAAGTAAAAHHYSGGLVPADNPDTLGPGPFNPGTQLDQQIDGLAGDLADLYTVDNSGDVTDDEVAAALGAAVGVYAYADLQTSDAFLDGTTSLYASLGVQTVTWNCMGGACGYCLNIESRNPYTIDNVPGPVHPRCRCWVTAADGSR